MLHRNLLSPVLYHIYSFPLVQNMIHFVIVYFSNRVYVTIFELCIRDSETIYVLKAIKSFNVLSPVNIRISVRTYWFHIKIKIAPDISVIA